MAPTATRWQPGLRASYCSASKPDFCAVTTIESSAGCAALRLKVKSVYSRRIGIVVAAFLCLTVSAAIACGPDFPWQLLDDRPATFKATPANSFAYEAVRLGSPPADGLKAIEGDDSIALA